MQLAIIFGGRRGAEPILSTFLQEYALTGGGFSQNNMSGRLNMHLRTELCTSGSS